MTKQTGKSKEIILGDSFGDVVVKANGVRVKITADGKATVAKKGKPYAVANDTAIVAAKVALEVGQKMADGTFYLGRFVSRDGTQRDYFAAAEDVKDGNGKRLSLNFNKAAEYAKNSKAHGHGDWMVPSGRDDRNGAPDILNAIFNNKAKIGGFDETGSGPSGWYWSSSPYDNDDYAKVQRLSDGSQGSLHKTYGLSVRLVRNSAI